MRKTDSYDVLVPTTAGVIVRSYADVTSESDRDLSDQLRSESVIMLYTRDRPYEVGIRFDPENTWVFARELLIHGVNGPDWYGDGRVRVKACDCSTRDHVNMCLDAPDERAIAYIGVPRVDVDDFLSQTLDVVPEGQESRHVDVDSLLVKLLS